VSTRYSIIGLGKLGCSMAAAIAKRGFQVVGVDIIPEVVAKVNSGIAPVKETDLQKTIEANKERIRATLDTTDAILNTDLSFVIVPTPSDRNGVFSLQYAAWAFKEIGRALASKNEYHNVVLTSTVLPGSTRYGLLPILEKESGKSCGSNFGLCYSPEFIALGSIIQDFLNPDFTLVGEFDERAGSQLESCYSRIMENSPPCKRMSIENAELTKIALNTFITTKITYANMLVELCEKIPGGDVDIVTDAIGTDMRIGAKFLKGALGYGGPCFPRDNVALTVFSDAVGVKAELAETTDRMNRELVDKIVDRLKPYLRPGITVAVLGLAYKPHSHVVEESQGIYLAKALASAGVRVISYDPQAKTEAREIFRDKALVLDDVESCLNQAHVVIITTPDPAFRALRSENFPTKDPPVVVFDCWRILRNKLAGKDHVIYIPMGVATDEQAIGRMYDLWGDKVS